MANNRKLLTRQKPGSSPLVIRVSAFFTTYISFSFYNSSSLRPG